MTTTAIEAVRAADACARCYERMVRDNPGGEDVRKRFPKHLKAICWAYLCDACAVIVIEAASKVADESSEKGGAE